MMRKSLLALFALSLFGPAQAAPAIWSVTGGGNTVYLFGSVHLLPQGGFAIDGELERAYRAAGQVCFEVDTSKLDPAETTAITLARAVDPDRRDLFELLGPAAGRARASAQAADIDLAQLAGFEPWFAGLTITLLALQQHGYDVDHGVEQVIEAAADQDGKLRCGLETLDGQLALLDGMPAELQQELLLQALEEAGKIDEAIAPLLAAWQDGNERELAASLDESFADYPELAEELIYARNARWADQVGELLDGDGDVLLVVGALHLVGKRGLPALLRERGYRVDRR